jgi:uncharacterized protein YceK
MKNNLLISLAVALAVAGCSTTPEQSRPETKPPKADRVQVLMYDTTARTKTSHLDIYDTKPPERPYKVIALLTCEGAPKEEAVMTTAIFYRARQIGAEGVMNAGTMNNSGSAIDALLGSSARCVFRYRAIVYDEKQVNNH